MRVPLLISHDLANSFLPARRGLRLGGYFRLHACMKNLFFWLGVFCVVLLLIARPAYALQIFVCGHSQYQCDLPDGNNAGQPVNVDLSGVSAAMAGIAAAGYMEIQFSDGSKVRVPLNTALPVPAPSVTAPSVVAAHSVYRTSLPNQAVTDHATWCAAQDAYVTYLNWNNAPTGSYVMVSCNEATKVAVIDQVTPTGPNFNSAYSPTVISVPAACPTGSTITGTAPNQTCVVDNPYALVADNAQNITRSENNYASVSGDLTGAKTASFGTVAGGTDAVSVVDSVAAGRPTSLTFNAVNGGTVVTQTTQAVDSSGATYLKKTTASFSSTGSLVSLVTSNIAGSLSGTETGGDGGSVVVAADGNALAPNPSGTGETSTSLTFCQENPESFLCAASTATGTVSTLAVSGLYEAGTLNEGKTFQSSVGDFKGRVLASNIGAAVGGFFTVNQVAGACPVWSVEVPMFGAFAFDFYCQSTFQNLLPWIRSVLLLIFSVIAFRIAVL